MTAALVGAGLVILVVGVCTYLATGRADVRFAGWTLIGLGCATAGTGEWLRPDHGTAAGYFVITACAAAALIVPSWRAWVTGPVAGDQS